MSFNWEGWLGVELVIDEGRREPAKEKSLVLQELWPFVRTRSASIELFHFTRIFEPGEGGRREHKIRFRVKPREPEGGAMRESVERWADGLVSSGRLIRWRPEALEYDSWHGRCGGKRENYDLFVRFMDGVSRVTIELLQRGEDWAREGLIPGDYYGHFLVNAFGGGSKYGPCPCAQGSFSVNPCVICESYPHA